MDLLATVKQSYHRHFSPTQPIYLACSGGRDSMALLYACHQLNLPIHVIHINHRLQAVSDDWQKLVENFCQTLNIACYSHRLTWQNPAMVNEQHARTARYQAIVSFVKPHAVVATAHHANDQAETLLMNLCKGTGLTGLVGMAEISEQNEFGKPLTLWRPLLTISRETISDFVNRHHIPYVDDPTNVSQSDTSNQRAFLRSQILPLLNQRFGNVIENINRTQTNLAQAKAVIDGQIQIDLQTCVLTKNHEQSQLNIVQLKNLTQARRFNLLHTWVKGEQKFAPNRQLIEQIEQLIFSQNPDQQAILSWQGVAIRRYRNVLYRLTAGYFAKNQQNLIALAKIFNLRSILPNEKLPLYGQSFHQSFKKICQTHAVPSWDRQFARVLQDDNLQALAVCLPQHIIWLAQSEHLTASQQQQITEKFEQVWRFE